MLIAVTRDVSPSIAECEPTHLDREPIDVAIAQTEHRRYEQSLVGDTVIYPSAFTETLGRLTDAGIQAEVVDVSEPARAEAGVTCCSLIFDVE